LLARLVWLLWRDGSLSMFRAVMPAQPLALQSVIWVAAFAATAASFPEAASSTLT
jgi:hypothetical protein